MSRPLEETPKSRAGKCFQSWFGYKDKSKWITEMKTTIGLTASIIATMTFSLATNPPGGIVQVGINDVSGLTNQCSNITKICAGQAVLGNLLKVDYEPFLICNTICFMAALSVILLLVSGFPLENTFIIWLLSTGMCITLISLALTYMFAASMVTPNSIWNSNVESVFGYAILAWAALVFIVTVFLTLRLIVRIVCKCCGCKLESSVTL